MASHVSPYAGSWYPQQPRKLDALLDAAFDRSGERTGPHLLEAAKAFLVPHAAPRYSGVVAAAAYRHLEAARPRRVFVLGFSHRRLGSGVEIPSVPAYAMPAGEIEVDRPAICALAGHPVFHLASEAELCDHSVEVQLPYLHRAARHATVVPLYVGRLDEFERASAAKVLAHIWRPGDVLVASSDLTHYGRDFHYVPFPTDAQVAARLRALDGLLIDAAGSLDSRGFLDAVRQSAATACGSQPISLMLETLSLLGSGELFQQELDYQTSGEITGDFTASVSYAAVGYFPRTSFELPLAERKELLICVDRTLRLLRTSGRAQPIPPGPSPELARRASVFITLRHEGRVIGCMGQLAGERPLAEVVPELAVSVALRDPRRLPVLPENVDVEISLLTPMKLVRGPEEIRIGDDGALIRIGARRALLLPQAIHQDWSAAELLDALYLKAGVPRRDEPRTGYHLYAFRAQVFRAAAD